MSPLPHMPVRANRTVVPVALGARAYEIVIGPGLLAEAGSRLAALAPGRRVAVVADRTVAGLHLDTLMAGCSHVGVDATPVLVEPGEGSKSFAGLERLCEGLLAARVERNDIVLALGGGVVGDLTGFASAVLRRGMRFVQVPTTLLAQVDSSVGGKTGINASAGKNLVGAFHQPALVLADTDTLDTLPPRERRAGYAELVKYGLIDDGSFVAWCEANWRAVLDANGPERAHAIAHACRSKAAIVTRDETETGDRALLNLGHTFGHALEAVTGYDPARLVHGEGVALGMVLAFEFSASLGLCGGDVPARVAAHLDAVGLPTQLDQVPGGVGTVEALLAAIRQDKKVQRGALTFILARGVGQAFIAPGIEEAAVRDFLAGRLASH